MVSFYRGTWLIAGGKLRMWRGLPWVWALALCVCAHAGEELDQYGGYTGIVSPSPPIGFFTAEKIGNRWWLITPDGHGFINLSVSVVTRSPNDGHDETGHGYAEYARLRFGAQENDPTWIRRWAVDTCNRLKSWGFNTIGTFSHEVQNTRLMPCFLTLRLSNYAIIHDGPVGLVWDGIAAGGPFPDIYHPAFLPFIEERMQRFTRYRDDPWVLGVFPDQLDELRGFDAEHPHLGYAALMGLPQIRRANGQITKNHFKAEFIVFLRHRHEKVSALNEAWGTSFASFDELWDVSNSDFQFPISDFETPAPPLPLPPSPFDPSIDGHPRFREDLDAFETKVAADYARMISQTVRTVLPNHLLFSPNLGHGSKRTILSGFAVPHDKPGASDSEPSGSRLPAPGSSSSFDIYFARWGREEYDILQRPILGAPGGFLSADPDSPLRFEGAVASAELVHDERLGELIKVTPAGDGQGPPNIRSQLRGNPLTIRFPDLPPSRVSMTRPWLFQLMPTGNNANGQIYFVARTSGGYRSGYPGELVDQINAELAAGRSPRFERTSFGDLTTQEERAKAWNQQLQSIIDDRGSNGDYFRVGLNWWKFSDNGWTYWLERYNFGLVTLKGNAYDGTEATRLGADRIPGTWDDEADDYGDLLTGVTEANKSIYKRILEKMDTD